VENKVSRMAKLIALAVRFFFVFFDRGSLFTLDSKYLKASGIDAPSFVHTDN